MCIAFFCSKFGMNLAYGLTAQEVHAMPPFEPLKISESIREFRAELAKGPYLQNLIKEHLIDNPHKVRPSLYFLHRDNPVPAVLEYSIPDREPNIGQSKEITVIFKQTSLADLGCDQILCYSERSIFPYSVVTSVICATCGP